MKTAILTPYFNYCGYKSREKAILTQKMSLEASGWPSDDYHVVELIFAGREHYQLPMMKNKTVLRSHSVMWQKERLLNYGIAKLLEKGYEAIVWVDADANLDAKLIALIQKKLETYRAVQGFDIGYYGDHESFGFVANAQMRDNEWIGAGGWPGGIWGARAEFLQKIELYDYCIIGGGDAVFAKTCVMANRGMSDPRFFVSNLPALKVASRHYIHNAVLYFNSCLALISPGDIGYVQQSVSFQTHGSLEKRKYESRHKLLGKYDPRFDVEIVDGVFEWTPNSGVDKAEMEGYFESRDEDAV